VSLQLDNLSLTVDGQPHIYTTNLLLEKSSMNVLLGPTLSGKTSLMRLMAGLDTPTVGRILWNGEDVTGKRVQDRDIAMVYQQFINYPSMTVYENIASPLRIMKKSKAEIDKAVKHSADMMKLGPYLDRKPLTLSGGQQQRCALARALVKGSGLVLLDEPLANLDYKLREELRAEIPKIFSESGAIFVYATTEPEEALLLGGNTATINAGRITQFDRTSSVYHQPQDTITAKTFSNPPMNFLKINKKGASITLGENTQRDATSPNITTMDTEVLNTAADDKNDNSAFRHMGELKDGEYIVGFRANHLELSQQSSHSISFSATLNITEITGSETFLHMHYNDEHWVGLVHGVHDLILGESIQVFLNPAHIYIFGMDGNIVSSAFYAKETV
jgi:glycerol transport system ATP-binding protein